MTKSMFKTMILNHYINETPFFFIIIIIED